MGGASTGGFGAFSSAAPQQSSGFSSFQSAAAPAQPKPSGSGVYAGGLVDLSNLGGSSSNTGGGQKPGQFGNMNQGGFGAFNGGGSQQQQKSGNDAFANICNF